MSRRSHWVLSMILCTCVAYGCGISLCEEGAYYCAILVDPQCPEKSGGEDCEYRQWVLDTQEPCILMECRNDNWSPTTNPNCQFGYHDDGMCATQCEENTYFCKGPNGEHLSDTDDTCDLNKCLDGRWQFQKTCEFGYHDEGSCVNPCEICPEGECPQLIYDEARERALSCSSRNGWSKDVTCTNDYTWLEQIESNDADLNELIYHTYASESLALVQDKIDAVKPTNFYYATCGECSEIGSPMYCTVGANEKSVFHVCDKGQFETYVDDSVSKCGEPDNEEEVNSKGLTKCQDDYRDIYVDLSNNRYHCGECGHACGTVQKCTEGQCVSNLSCGDDGYTDVQVGSQWFHARCIEDIDALKKLRDEVNAGELGLDKDNYDNAYVLIHSIDIDEDWTPIGLEENPFSGIFFGNGNSVTFHQNLIAAEGQSSVGLFGVMDNSRVEYLEMAWDSDQIIENVDSGILAGKVYGGAFDGIKLTTKKELTFKSNRGGGLIGYAAGTADNPVLIKNIQLENIKLETHYKKTREDLYGSGGYVGYAEHTQISNSKINGMEIFPHVEEATDMGGLLGIGSYYYSLTGPLGGMVGAGKNVVIQNSSLSNLKVHPTVISVGNTVSDSYIGGYIGSASESEISDCTAEQISFEMTDDAPTNINSFSKGCLIGSCTLGRIYSNHVKECHIHKGENLGGIVGNSSRDTIKNNVILDSEISGTSSISCVSGYSSRSSIIEVNAKNCVLNGKNAGGIIGNDSYASSIESSSSESNTIIGQDSLGGLIGYGLYTQVDSSVSKDNQIGSNGSSNKLGGLIGYGENTQIYSSVSRNNIIGPEGNVSGLGGIIGSGYNSQVLESASEDDKIGNQNAGSNIGGLIGIGSGNLLINKSYTKNDVLTGKNQMGGLVGIGENGIYIGNSFAENLSVSGVSQVGGLIGYVTNNVEASAKKDITLNASWFAGKIQGTYEVGGLIGHINPYYPPKINSSSSYAQIVIKDKSGLTTKDVGGIIGSFISPDTRFEEINFDSLNTIHQFIYGGSATISNMEVGDFVGFFKLQKAADWALWDKVELNVSANNPFYSIASSVKNFNALIGNVDITGTSIDKLQCEDAYFYSRANSSRNGEKCLTGNVCCKNANLSNVTTTSSLVDTLSAKTGYYKANCYSDGFKTAMGCEGTECDNLMSQVCTTSNCTRFNLPVPVYKYNNKDCPVMPTFCEYSSTNDENTYKNCPAFTFDESVEGE